MKRNKINLALAGLGLTFFLLGTLFTSITMILCSIALFVVFVARTGLEVSAENIASGVESATIGELLDEQLSEKAKSKLAAMSGEERNKIAHRFAHEIGSDTQPLTFKKHSIIGDKA